MADAGKKSRAYEDYRPDKGKTEKFVAGKDKAKIVTKVVKRRK